MNLLVYSVFEFVSRSLGNPAYASATVRGPGTACNCAVVQSVAARSGPDRTGVCFCDFRPQSMNINAVSNVA